MCCQRVALDPAYRDGRAEFFGARVQGRDTLGSCLSTRVHLVYAAVASEDDLIST